MVFLQPETLRLTRIAKLSISFLKCMNLIYEKRWQVMQIADGRLQMDPGYETGDAVYRILITDYRILVTDY